MPSRPVRIRQASIALLQHYGAQNWWPADSPFEVAVGAILVQRTAWKNANLALANLRNAGSLTPQGLHRLPVSSLEALLRPSGFYRQKAQGLKALTAFLNSEHAGSIESLLALPLVDARHQLLSLKGIGPETADAILLYAGGFPTFIVDTYARRFFSRTRIIRQAMTLSYRALQECVETSLLDCPLPTLHSRTPNHPVSLMSGRELSPQARLFAELHACIVRAEIENLQLSKI